MTFKVLYDLAPAYFFSFTNLSQLFPLLMYFIQHIGLLSVLGTHQRQSCSRQLKLLSPQMGLSNLKQVPLSIYPSISYLLGHLASVLCTPTLPLPLACTHTGQRAVFMFRHQTAFSVSSKTTSRILTVPPKVWDNIQYQITT